MAAAEREPVERLLGASDPRIAPPVPAKSRLAEYEAAARKCGLVLMPWQRTAARYFMASRGRGRGRQPWLYREVAIVVARQNGKTSMLAPRIVLGMEAGESILHTAQNRKVPLEVYRKLLAVLDGNREYIIHRAFGGEEIIHRRTGGSYKLLAPNSGSRGLSADLLLIDEVREQDDEQLMDAMLPTLTASPTPQAIYLSNAGHENSVVLNELRRRGLEGTDAEFAYLEWSASPDLAPDDPRAWAEANPALGRRMPVESLEYARRSRPLAGFETEHLCRWVVSDGERLVGADDWLNCRGIVGDPARPAMAVSMDPTGSRAAAVIGWLQGDGSIALQVVADVHGSPIDTTRLGRELQKLAVRLRITDIGFDSFTDADIARWLPGAKAIGGAEYANASEFFVRSVMSSQLRWDDAAEVVAGDLRWTTRKYTAANSGAYMAVKADDARAIPAALAAVRVAWLASRPRPPAPKVL